MDATIEAWLLLIAERIRAEADTLTRLDQAIGDGDHGVNLDRGFNAVVATTGTRPPSGTRPSAGDDVEAASERLRLAGRTLISTVGGASGPLYGTALLRAATAIRSGHPGAATGELLVLALEGAVEGVAALGRSTTGEKTMLDALTPAAEAARTALTSGEDVSGIVRAAAEAAEAGAERTIPMLATKGRASYLGERSIGHKDPGAASSALIMRALADTVGA